MEVVVVEERSEGVVVARRVARLAASSDSTDAKGRYLFAEAEDLDLDLEGLSGMLVSAEVPFV